MSESKAALVRQLKERGLPVPKGAKVADLKHRLKHWKSPNGLLIRLGLPVKKGTLAEMLQPEKVYWVPDSDFAVALLKTQVIYVLTRQTTPPEEAIILDVPIDF
tara:strand:- start:90 stop:401 length:312 start_codon:yes stop_codon:yes gene_type:complete